jgi:2-polyprenyl-3-methyl-5-hydroxy-6-metoxy-1,4-benzoquinol methylase
MIRIVDPFTKNVLQEDLVGLKGVGSTYPMSNGVYIIAAGDNYTDNFGLQWKAFKKTQIDKFNGTNQSKERLKTIFENDLTQLNNKDVLEVGSGAGRFTQILLDHTTANVYSVDYSEAVEANSENNGPHDRLKLFRASVYDLPFEEHSFDYVLLFGVLQHTPDTAKTINTLAKMVKPNGHLIVDFYPRKGFYTLINAKYMLRAFIRNMPHEKLLKRIRRHAGWMIRLSRFFKKIKLGFLNRFIPICDIDTTIPTGISKEQLKEWVILDTFDMFSPAFDSPQKVETVKDKIEKNGFDILFAGIRSFANNSIAFVHAKKKE